MHKAVVIVIVNCIKGRDFQDEMLRGGNGRGDRCSGNEDWDLWKQMPRGHTERAQDRRQRPDFQLRLGTAWPPNHGAS